MACVGFGSILWERSMRSTRSVLYVCWDAARNGKLPTISSLSTLGYVFALLRFSILIRKTLYGLFGCCWLLCLFSFRFWCVINAHRKFQQHHDTNKRRSASSMLWLGSARWMNKISWPRSMQNGESSFVCLSLCLSVRLSSCLRISVYFLVYWFLLWRWIWVSEWHHALDLTTEKLIAQYQ